MRKIHNPQVLMTSRLILKPSDYLSQAMNITMDDSDGVNEYLLIRDKLYSPSVFSPIPAIFHFHF